jgi:hypothetical protein
MSAILAVRCSDTIPAQNWINTLVDKVGMVRVTRSGGFNGGYWVNAQLKER